MRISDKLVFPVLRLQGQPERIVVIARMKKPPWVRIDKLVVGEAELREELVAVWLVDILAREGAARGGPSMGENDGNFHHSRR